MTYEYLCIACGHQWEAEQSISAAPLKKCPACSKSKAKRQVSGGMGFILKGGGWYADGYASETRNQKPSQKPKGDAPSEAAGSKKTNVEARETSKPQKAKAKGSTAKRSSAAA